VIVSNVLTEEKKQQVLTLGRLGWSLRRIEKQTAAANLKAAGIALRPPGAWGKRAPPKPANAVTTDSTGSASACEPVKRFVRKQRGSQLPEALAEDYGECRVMVRRS